MRHPSIIASAFAACAFSCVHADLYEVRFSGSVEWNSITAAPLSAGTAGSPATVVFQVESTDFVNSQAFPTRGYTIIPSTFRLILNGTEIGMSPSVVEPRYFVLRNNDPAVDGFFISADVNGPTGVELNQTHPTWGPYTELCGVTYSGNTLSSLNIEDAVGSYGYDGIQVFSWETSLGPFSPQGMIFEQLTITPVASPCPADINGSGTVDGADLGELLASWGTPNAGADLDGSGTVDGADLGALLAAWGNCG